MAANFLGEFPFVTFNNTVGLSGAPLLLRQENEIIQRPGVNGTGIRRTGVKGVTFQMVSTRDNSNQALAAQEYNLYTVLTQEDAQPIRFKGLDYDSFGVLYVVVDVSDPLIMPLRNKVGGLLGTQESAVKLTVTWTLVPVRMDQLGGQLTNG